VVAEIGQNHQGEMGLARELIDAAAWAGVDAVKGQKRSLVPGLLFTQDELDRPYTGKNSFGRTYGEHRAALEFTTDQHAELKRYAESKGITYSLSVWDPGSLGDLDALDCEWVKLPSACLTWHDLIRAAALLDRPLILSTGMSTNSIVQKATELAFNNGDLETGWLAVLQCTSAYPCEGKYVDLNVIDAWTDEDAYECIPHDVVGLSGHHRGIAIDCAAVALGARIIERHVTLDRGAKGSDHAAALEPKDLHQLVRNIRETEEALGSYEKRLHDCELASMAKLRTKIMRSG
jgi:sialic acid synthase SpsE